MQSTVFSNPFRPGAGHMPPYLAGRVHETNEFKKLLTQNVVLDNLILTGLRGIGKTVLLDTFKPLAVNEGWLWMGSALSESASVTENSLVTRVLTDISLVTTNLIVSKDANAAGFQSDKKLEHQNLDYNFLTRLYNGAGGLVSDRLKFVLEYVWTCIARNPKLKGMIFAFDEAQTMTDHSEDNEYPLSVLLDVFQSIQKKNIPFMLVLVGLPTLFPKLVETRTYTERMFRVLTLTKLSKEERSQAIKVPIEQSECPVSFDDESIELIIDASGGYPYFIQFICREVYDIFLQKLAQGVKASVPLNEIMAKLDNDFFSGRWLRATDRQRDLLTVISELENCDEEFTIAEIVERAGKLPKPLSASHISQMLTSLIQSGLIYKNRYSKYSFAVPLLGEFIKRQNK